MNSLDKLLQKVILFGMRPKRIGPSMSPLQSAFQTIWCGNNFVF